jgi:hypothetical protein
MQQPPFEQKMPMEGAGPQQPAASQGAPQAKAQADRKATREVPRDQIQKAMQVASEAMYTALYKTKGIGRSVMKMISPEDKVGSTAKAATAFLSNLSKQTGMPERIAVPMVALAADEIMSLAESANGITYSEQEAKQVVITAAELTMSAYGVPPERAEELARNSDKGTLQKAESAYKETLDG